MNPIRAWRLSRKNSVKKAHLERRSSLLHSEADVLVEDGPAIAEDVKEDGMLVGALLSDELNQPPADARQPVPPPEQVLHRRRAAQRDAAVDRARFISSGCGQERSRLRARFWAKAGVCSGVRWVGSARIVLRETDKKLFCSI